MGGVVTLPEEDDEEEDEEERLTTREAMMGRWAGRMDAERSVAGRSGSTDAALTEKDVRPSGGGSSLDGGT